MAYNSWTGDPSKGAVPPGEHNLLVQLYIEWQQLTGFTLELSDANFLAMANAGITDIRQFGYMASSMVNTGNFVWSDFGMTRETYATTLLSYQDLWSSLTGEDVYGKAPTGLLAEGFMQHWTTGELRNKLMSDTNTINTYGWLKYGLDYHGFKQEKIQMRTAFGHELSNDEAVQQLGYYHAARGANFNVTAPSPQRKEPAGISGSIAR